MGEIRTFVQMIFAFFW